MKVNRSQFFHTLILWVFLSGCAIEVGNPNEDDEDVAKSEITVSIADAPVDDAKHIYLNITGISLIVDDNHLLPLNFEGPKELDILSFQDGASAALGNMQSVPAATYQGFLIHLSDDVGYLVGQDDKRSPIRLPENSPSLIAVKEPFTLEAAGSEDVVLHIDLRQSLSGDANSGYTLDPVVTPIARKKAGHLYGYIPEIGKGVACAYFLEGPTGLSLVGSNEPSSKPISRDGKRRLMDRVQKGPKGEYRKAKRPGRGGKPRKPKDASFICPDAYGSSFIKADGLFVLPFIEPGTYELRVFTKDKGVFDVRDSIVVTSGIKTKIENIVLE